MTAYIGPSLQIPPFRSVFTGVFGSSKDIPTIDQYHSYFRGRAGSSDFTTSNFYTSINDRATKGAHYWWIWLFFHLPPLLFSLPPNGGKHSQHMTPLLSANNGQVLTTALKVCLQEKWSTIPMSELTTPSLEALNSLYLYSIGTQPKDNHMVLWTSHMYRFKFERYGKARDKENLKTFDDWLIMKEAFYQETLHPMILMYQSCLGDTKLKCSAPEKCFELPHDPNDPDPIRFDMLIYDKNSSIEVLPVVCLDLLNWHSQFYCKPEERTPPATLDMIRFSNTAKLRMVKRYLMMGRSRSVLVTDFECALLVRVDHELLKNWDFREHGTELLPLAVTVFSGLEPCPAPLKFAIFSSIEFEYWSDSGMKRRACQEFTRNRRAFYVWHNYRSNAYQWHRVVTCEYFRDLILERERQLKTLLNLPAKAKKRSSSVSSSNKRKNKNKNKNRKPQSKSNCGSARESQSELGSSSGYLLLE